MKNFKTIILATLLSIFGTAPALALDHTYTNADEWAIYEAFHTAFWDRSNRNYKADTAQPGAKHRGNGARDNDYSGCSAAIWCQAIYFDMAVNAYKRRLEDPYSTEAEIANAKSRMTTVYNGEKAHYVNFNFDNSNTNNGWFVYDDIMWWTVALARAYAVSVQAGQPVNDYLKYSEKSFCRVWYGSKTVGDDGSYADPSETGADGNPFTGGMFWEWQPIDHAKPHSDNGFKSACINFPTVIACCTLYDLVPEDRETPTGDYPTYQTREFYLDKAKEIYAWAKDHFCSAQYPGRVADGIHGAGPEWSDHLYNQATYIGASCLLYKLTGEEQYLTNAREAADYTKNKMGSSKRGVRILAVENGYEQGVYAAIFAQYIKMLIDDCGQEDYRQWIEDNIEYGWEYRDQTRNLQDANLIRSVGANDVVESYGGSALPALMLMFPVKGEDAAVSSPAASKKKSDVYTLDGIRIGDNDHLAHGIYVSEGRKFLVK